MSGGGGLGGILKTLAPMALSYAIPGLGTALAPSFMSAGLGATAADALSSGLVNGAISGGLGLLTHSKNPLQDALMGGAAGAAGNYFGGVGNKPNPLDGATVEVPNASAGANVPVNQGGGISPAAALPGPVSTDPISMAHPEIMSQAAPSGGITFDKTVDWIGNHPIGAALIGGTGLTALDALTSSPKKIKSPSNGYDDALPEYHVESNSNPYTGDWYTYGFSPQTPMIDNQLKKGPAQPYAKGGAVKNPLLVQDTGAGGHADDVNARLSSGEFVLPADVVSALGDGATDTGGKKLDAMVKNVRKHKATKKFPPKARNPLAYIGG